jgi:hypothetical protein
LDIETRKVRLEFRSVCKSFQCWAEWVGIQW